MIEYWVSSTAVPIELFILSGGTTVTGRTPTVEIRNKDGGLHYDFATRTFLTAPATTSLALTSAIDGLYRAQWDCSGVFATSAFLTFEYHDTTALALEDVNFVRPPLVSADVNVQVGGGGGGVVHIKGLLSDDQKKKLFDTLDDIKEGVNEFRQQALPILRGLMSRKAVEKKDIEFLNRVKERDSIMYRELLNILKMRESASSKEVVEKLGAYLGREEKDKQELLKLLTEKLNKKAVIKVNENENEEDDDDE